MSDIALAFQTNKIVDPADRMVYRAHIAEVEKKMLEMPSVPIPVEHLFSKGVYARTMTVPHGTLLTGKIHKHKNLNIISKGDVSFFSVDGSVRVQAPYIFVAEPGTKRIIYAHSETVWTTIHGTELTDLEEIEAEFLAKDYSEIDGITAEDLKIYEEAIVCLGL